MERNTGSRDRLSDDFLVQLATTLEQLGGSQPGVGFVHLVHLARQVPRGSSITVDFTKSKLCSSPLVIVALTPDEPEEPCWVDLTPREKDVARLLASGLSNKIIARRLGITLGTVKSYVHRILAKTGTGNRTSFASQVKLGSP
jgi:two-component system, NarL family, nitrate/nitrite response regulator NarL